MDNCTEFGHYLITRFNIFVDNPSWRTDKIGNNVQTDEWLINRFRLFDKYTVPSIKNQSCKNFKWLVLFNSETPDSFKEKIMLYQDDIPQFTPIFVVPHVDDATKVTKKYIETNNTKDYVITTRIDNDDMIHRDYLKKVQELFRPQENLFISFRNGIQYSIINNTIQKYNFIRNHYTSLIEKQGKVQTVSHYNHGKINLFGEILISNDSHMWVEIVHRGNLINDERMSMVINIDYTNILYGTTLPQEQINKFSFGYLFRSIKYYISLRVEDIKIFICKLRS